MRLEVSREVAAPREVVWGVLTTWERQPDWMVDAKDVEVLTPERVGEGVTIRCPTNLLGLTVQDLMRVTGWVEPSYLEVTHYGRVIAGVGAFELEQLDTGHTRVRWWEKIDPPLGVVGGWGARWLALPVLTRMFGRSLGRLAELAERDAARGV